MPHQLQRDQTSGVAGIDRNFLFHSRVGMEWPTRRKSKPEALSFGRGRRRPKTLGEVAYTKIEGPFQPDPNGMRYFMAFIEEGTHDKRVVALNTRNVAAETAGHCFDQMLREDVSVKCISGDVTGELGRSGFFREVLAERGVRWRSSVPRTQQSDGIAA